MRYQHSKVEKKWQEAWKKEKLFQANNTAKDKYYLLVELAYSSGDLHIGHWFSWTVPDVLARFKRMQGKNVLFPVGGFDSFGLPAENAAIKRNIHPADWTNKNIKTMREQFATLGPSFDWGREVITSEPNYYKWTQWLFLELYDAGLIYKDKIASNWCPNCKTVLANEHVENGCCWRHPDTKVVQKKVEQWLVRITDYADRLIWPDKPEVDWPKAHREGQNNWIGKSEGVLIDFEIKPKLRARVFTTRPDTLEGATFLVLSPEYAQKLARKANRKLDTQVLKYIKESLNKSEEDRKKANKAKTGIDTGFKALNPLTKEEIPVFVADYVLEGVGTGAIMAVPSHDDRDRAFAQAHKLRIKKFTPDQGLWKRYKKVTTYRLRDWSISRHRYWGAPIPIIYCDKCGIVPVPAQDLPVELPREVDYTPTGKAPLATAEDWVKVDCPECGQTARRETQTMDTYVDSSWYFLRYIDPKNKKEPFGKKLAKEWLPIKVYFGGSEHVYGHTLYARFITRFLQDRDYLKDFSEFATRRVNHGIVLGPDGNKMSKSRGNVVNPDAEVAKYGADTVRLYLCFMGPHENAAPWSQEGVEGMHRFLRRVWSLFESPVVETNNAWVRNKTIQKVTKDIENLQMNTAIASIMEYANHLRIKGANEEDLKILAQLLAPFAPHLTEEVWVNVLGEEFSVHRSSWPVFDIKDSIEKEKVIIIQVDGKKRSQIKVRKELADKKDKVVNLAQKEAKTVKWIKNKTIKDIVFVPGKIVNFVTE